MHLLTHHGSHSVSILKPLLIIYCYVLTIRLLTFFFGNLLDRAFTLRLFRLKIHCLVLMRDPFLLVLLFLHNDLFRSLTQLDFAWAFPKEMGIRFTSKDLLFKGLKFRLFHK